MDTRTGNYDQQSLDSRCDGNGEGCEYNSARWNLDGLFPGAAESHLDGGPPSRHIRFEPITVGAATRVVELERVGVVLPKEARFYLRELLAMDCHADVEAYPALLRLAERQASFQPGIQARASDGSETGHYRRMDRVSLAFSEPCLTA